MISIVAHLFMFNFVDTLSKVKLRPSSGRHCLSFDMYLEINLAFTSHALTPQLNNCERKADDWKYMRSVCHETSAEINKAKDDHFSNLGKKLSDPTNCFKSYWATSNKIINKKRFSNIPPLLENGVFVTNFQTKANIFNDHFVEQCSVIMNDSVLPNLVSRCDSLLSNVELLLKIVAYNTLA